MKKLFLSVILAIFVAFPCVAFAERQVWWTMSDTGMDVLLVYPADEFNFPAALCGDVPGQVNCYAVNDNDNDWPTEDQILFREMSHGRWDVLRYPDVDPLFSGFVEGNLIFFPGIVVQIR